VVGVLWVLDLDLNLERGRERALVPTKGSREAQKVANHGRGSPLDDDSEGYDHGK